MDFKSKFMLFNGAYLTIDEVKNLYKRAFNHNLVTVLIPSDNDTYKVYPPLNFQSKETDNYYRNLGHAKCFHLINEALKTNAPKYYVATNFKNIQDRYVIANYFLEKKMAIIMATSKDNFILMFPALSENEEKNMNTFPKILGLMDVLNIKDGWLQVDGIIYDNLNDFREYVSFYSSNYKKKR